MHIEPSPNHHHLSGWVFWPSRKAHINMPTALPCLVPISPYCCAPSSPLKLGRGLQSPILLPVDPTGSTEAALHVGWAPGVPLRRLCGCTSMERRGEFGKNTQAEPLRCLGQRRPLPPPTSLSFPGTHCGSSRKSGPSGIQPHSCQVSSPQR